MPNEMSESDVFVLLAKRRRRLALQILRDSATPVPAKRLAERIADRERDDPTPEDVQRIFLTLYHVHLPKLDAADAVSYDPSDGTVRPGLHFERLVRTLERVTDADRPWADE